MRELNEFNKNVIQTFASRQAYRQINGHYIPIIMGAISDESVVEIQPFFILFNICIGWTSLSNVTRL